MNVFRRMSVTGIVLFFAFTTITYSQSHQIGENIEERIDTVFDRGDGNFKTAVACVMQKGNHTIYKKSFGSANLEFDIPFSSNTKFSSGAIGKQIIALATLLAEDLNLISLEDDIVDYFPELSDIASNIRIKHLLSHTSGLHEIEQLKRLSGVAAGTEY